MDALAVYGEDAHDEVVLATDDMLDTREADTRRPGVEVHEGGGGCSMNVNAKVGGLRGV